MYTCSIGNNSFADEDSNVKNTTEVKKSFYEVYVCRLKIDGRSLPFLSIMFVIVIENEALRLSPK